MKTRLIPLALLFVLFASLNDLKAQNIYSIDVLDVSTGSEVLSGSYTATSGGKVVSKGKFDMGIVIFDAKNFQNIDISLSAQGYEPRVIKSLASTPGDYDLYMIPNSGLWLSLSISFDSEVEIKNLDDFSIGLMESGSTESYSLLENNSWIAIPLSQDKNYNLIGSPMSRFRMNEIFMNTTGFPNDFILKREIEVKVILNRNDYIEDQAVTEEIETETAQESVEEVAETDEVVAEEVIEAEPVKEEVIAVREGELPPGAIAVDLSKYDEMETGSNETVTAVAATAYVSESTVYFPSGKATLSSEALSFLDGLIEEQKSSGKKLRIEVYSDTDMEESIEDYICELRADIITSYLIKEGMSFWDLEVSLIGTKILANDCKTSSDCDAQGHQANRRVKFIFQ